MKRLFTFFLSIILLFSCTSCESIENSDKISVVCTIFAPYDWTSNIIGDNDDIDLIWLINTGVDIHSYQPTAQDILKIKSADLLICSGGELDSWAYESLDDTSKALKLNDFVELKKAEHIDEAENHKHKEHSPGYDEHIWLSLSNAMKLCDKITDRLCALTEENSQIFKSNNEIYKKKIDALDDELSLKVESKCKPLIFADRFPFIYFTQDYKLSYFAAFDGCSADTQSSFETVIFLSQKVNENNISYVFTVDSGNTAIATTVIDNCFGNVEELNLNSLQSISQTDADNDVNYVKIMEQNIKKVIKAL